MNIRPRHTPRFSCDAAGEATKGDPTGTMDIQRRYVALVGVRWRQFTRLLKMTVLGQDLLGIASSKPNSLSLALAGMGADAKIRAFQSWVDKALETVVLENDTTYLDPMVTLAYNRGVVRGMRQTSNVKPEHAADQILGLQQFVMTELQGVNEAVSQQLVRLGSQAIIDGANPPDLFKAMVDVVEKVGVVRSRALVATMVVKANGTGLLDQFEAAGVKAVGIVPEFVKQIKDALTLTDAKRKAQGPGSRISRTQTPSRSTINRIRRANRKLEALKLVNVLTAGDDNVCPICEGIEQNGPYTINQARSLIPAHPSCRCSFVPANDNRFADIPADVEE